MKLGCLLFKLRSSTPIPVILLYIFFYRQSIVLLFVGIFGILAGEYIRIASVSFIGPVSRTRGDTPGALVENGPYAIIRNPLYAANFLIFSGFILTSNNLWYILIASFLFFTQYYFIVRWEEHVLEEKYGAAYLEYKNRVRCFIPSLKDVFNRNNYSGCNIAVGIKSERWTFVTVFILISLPVFCYFYRDLLAGPLKKLGF